jgi:uncharacterized membrane protein YgcG
MSSSRQSAVPLLLLPLLLLLALVSPASAADNCVRISGFSGCSWSGCGVVHNCIGGDRLTISGSGFDILQPGQWGVQLDNQFDCTNASVTVGSVVCSLPDLTAAWTAGGQSQTVQLFNASSGNSLLCEDSKQNPVGVFYGINDVRQSATGVSGAAASCSWSSAAPASIPVVQRVRGCNPSNPEATTGCDGSGQARLTIDGLNFTPQSLVVVVQGAATAYQCKPTDSNEQHIQCSGLTVDTADLNRPLPLYVSNGLGYWSDQPIMLTFSSGGGGGGGGASGGSGGGGGGGGSDGSSGALLSSLWLIVVGGVLGVIVISALLLCVLSRWCGVRLPLICRRCCAPPDDSQPLLASQQAAIV